MKMLVDMVRRYFKVCLLEHREASTDTLFAVEWLRVVLDEAHNCKSRLSRSAKACCAFKARNRWALTG